MLQQHKHHAPDAALERGARRVVLEYAVLAVVWIGLGLILSVGVLPFLLIGVPLRFCSSWYVVSRSGRCGHGTPTPSPAGGQGSCSLPRR